MKKTLDELLEESRKIVEAMSPEQKAEMLRKQGEGWAKSEAQWAKAEAQWAKDFREGKCKYD